MSTQFAIHTLIELAVACLIVYGFMHEDKLIAFEQAVKRIVIGNIRRAIRIHENKKASNRRLNKGGVIPTERIPVRIVFTDMSRSDIVPIGEHFQGREIG